MFSALKNILGTAAEEGTPPPSDLHVTKLFIHPIKSCKGTSVSEARYDPEGLQYDRKMVIVDAKTHVAITARDLSKMLLIHPQILADPTAPYGGEIRISFPEDSDCEAFSVPLNPSEDLLQSWPMVDDAKVWESSNDGYVVQCPPSDDSAAYGPDTPSETLSTFLKRNVLLVFKGPRKRFVVPTASFPDLEANAAFHDGYPVLVASDASAGDIGRRVRRAGEGEWEVFGLDKDVWRDKEFAIERFRPNVVFGSAGEGLVPFDEERWEEVVIGEEGAGGRFLLVSRCYRCQIPNMDPTTSIEDRSVPAQILNKYRRTDLENPSASCFGVNTCPLDSGVIRVGDPVRVVRWVKGGGVLPIPPPNSG